MDLLSLLDAVQNIARNGLEYSQNVYDRERYTQLLTLAQQRYHDVLDIPHDDIRNRFRDEFGHITPKVGADAAIFNERGEILLMERTDGSGWCLPCGWVEPLERPADTAIRETREETGLDVQVTHLVGVFTRMPGAYNGPHTTISIVYLCDIVGGELTLSHEGLALRYWPIDEVPDWHATHEKYARTAYKMWRSDRLIPAISE